MSLKKKHRLLFGFLVRRVLPLPLTLLSIGTRRLNHVMIQLWTIESMIEGEQRWRWVWLVL